MKSLRWLESACLVVVITTIMILGPFRQGAVVHAMVMERPSSRNGRSSGRPSKNADWYNKRRNQGIKVPRGKKPPQWEKEGDALYQEIIQDNPYRTVHEKMTKTMAEQLLQEKLEGTDENTAVSRQEMTSVKSPVVEVPPEPPFLWGGLSVGPVWKQRLVEAGFALPTPIQSAAFTPIIQTNENLILASATGSGKSLAYLLPLLTTRQEESLGRVWIVTPTNELAVQLQRMVATLLKEDLAKSPTVHVLNPTATRADDDYDNEGPLLTSLVDSSSFILAGTPRTFQQLLDEMDQPIIVNKTLRQVAKTLSEHLQTLVFDEADRLFQTEAVARSLQERRPSSFGSNNKPTRQQQRMSTPLALQLLESITHRFQFRRSHQYTTSNQNNKQVKLICASATVGRTLRRQLMEVLQTPSMEKAATLITEPIRTKKDALARKNNILPSTLQHAYRLVPEEGKDDEEAAPVLVSCVVETLEKQLDPAPTLIFPGRTGVAAVQAELKRCGWEKVYGLDDIVSGVLETTSVSDWKRIPVFVVSEKLGRGLDIPQLGYVLLLQVPSSAAGYTHLAGRTGRNGQQGLALTFCRAREAPKLVVIAETLGLVEGSFQNLGRDKK